MHMYELFGAAVIGNTIEFRLFFPDAAADPTQYSRGGSPKIDSVRVVGSFQGVSGGQDWEVASAPVMQKQAHPKGWLYICRVSPVPDGFYEYKYYVTFANGVTRWCCDPCTKYGGTENANSAFVVG